MGNVICCDQTRRRCCVMVVPPVDSNSTMSSPAPATRSTIGRGQGSPGTREASCTAMDNSAYSHMENSDATAEQVVTRPTAPEDDPTGTASPSDGTALQQWVHRSERPVIRGSCVLCGKLVLLEHKKFRWESGSVHRECYAEWLKEIPVAIDFREHAEVW